jgi:hypothetical protein
MKNRGLKSSYTVAYFKVHHSTCNEAKTTNVLNRKFLWEGLIKRQPIRSDRNRLDLCTSREKKRKKMELCLFHFGSVQSRNSRLFLWRT